MTLTGLGGQSMNEWVKEKDPADYSHPGSPAPSNNKAEIPSHQGGTLL